MSARLYSGSNIVPDHSTVHVKSFKDGIFGVSYLSGAIERMVEEDCQAQVGGENRTCGVKASNLRLGRRVREVLSGDSIVNKDQTTQLGQYGFQSLDKTKQG